MQQPSWWSDHSCGWVVYFPTRVTSEELSELESYLSQDERARRDRLVIEEQRHRFSVCRGQLRRVLASVLLRKPGSIRFSYGRSGKPYLSVEQEATYHFNLSHSREWAAIALHPLSAIGIDLQFDDPQIDDHAVASLLFTAAEMRRWQAIEPGDRHRRLMEHWVSKEALVKYWGGSWLPTFSAIELASESKHGWQRPVLDTEKIEASMDATHAMIDGNVHLSPHYRLLEEMPVGCFGAVACGEEVKAISCFGIEEFVVKFRC